MKESRRHAVDTAKVAGRDFGSDERAANVKGCYFGHERPKGR